MRKAETRASVLSRVVREFREANQGLEANDPGWQSRKHREIEVAVSRYNEVHKALRRIQKKIQTKRKDTLAVRVFRSVAGRF